MRKSLKSTSQVSAPASAAAHESPSETPRPVATPLPPRNPSQTGKQWPSTAATAQAAARASWLANGAGSASVRDQSTGARPFTASRISVAAAAPLPAARATLVAPMLPEPTARTSFPVFARAIKRPKGIDPQRYAATMRSSAELTRHRGRARTASWPQARLRPPPAAGAPRGAKGGQARARTATRTGAAASARSARSARAPRKLQAGSPRGRRAAGRAAGNERRASPRRTGRAATSRPGAGRQTERAAERRAAAPPPRRGSAPRRRRSPARAPTARPNARRGASVGHAPHRLRQGETKEDENSAGGAAEEEVGRQRDGDGAAGGDAVRRLHADAGRHDTPHDRDEPTASGQGDQREGSERIRHGGERRGKAATVLAEDDGEQVGDARARVHEHEREERREQRRDKEQPRRGGVGIQQELFDAWGKRSAASHPLQRPLQLLGPPAEEEGGGELFQHRDHGGGEQGEPELGCPAVEACRRE